PCRVSHAYGLASSGFARHYSRNHGCFLVLRARAVGREARKAAQQVLAALTPLAVRTAPGATDDGQVLSASFLVPAADEERFRQVVAAQAEAYGDRLALAVTGPLPCYSFVQPGPLPAGR
ncbi:GvpL/GvpF family gas vesicle protein, partial [Streptomyces sp. NPDC003487]